MRIYFSIAVFLSFLYEFHSLKFCPWKLQGQHYCGSDDRTYESLCEIKLAMHRNPKIEIMYKGPCTGHSSEHVKPTKLSNIKVCNGSGNTNNINIKGRKAPEYLNICNGDGNINNVNIGRSGTTTPAHKNNFKYLLKLI